MVLFHEIYGSYYAAATSILREAADGNLTGREITELVEKHGFGESMLTIPDGLKGKKWALLHEDFSTPLLEGPSMPLTTLEKQWLKTLLLDPRIKLFGPDMTGLEDVKPLFSPDRIVYYDRYADGDDYSDPLYISNFRTIIKCLREKRNLYVCFETGIHAHPKLVVTPHYLEYSEKDDRFRLVGGGQKRRWTINLSRITSCEPAYGNVQVPLREAKKGTITFEMYDRRNAMERVLLHFSHLEKETKKIDEDRYLVTLKYDKQDETEMVIRILSFGPVLKVIEPESFIEQLKKRINKQITIIGNESKNNLEDVKDICPDVYVKNTGDHIGD